MYMQDRGSEITSRPGPNFGPKIQIRICERGSPTQAVYFGKLTRMVNNQVQLRLEKSPLEMEDKHPPRVESGAAPGNLKEFKNPNFYDPGAMLRFRVPGSVHYKGSGEWKSSCMLNLRGSAGFLSAELAAEETIQV